MKCSTKPFPFQAPSPKFAAALEVLGFLLVAAVATVCFLTGHLTTEQSAGLTLLILISLIVLAWTRFDGGRHPCFLFLCMLTIFQAGRLIASWAGGESDTFRIDLMTPQPFDVSREVAGLVLLSIAFSAIAIYAACRWNYRSYFPSPIKSSCHLLPYLYFLFWLTVPVQLYKNFCYYQYTKDHGGYLVIFLDHGGMASSIPAAVRAVSLISMPAFVGIFVLEHRKQFLRPTVFVYFAVTTPILLLGSRGGIFSLVLSLWYVSKVKSAKPTRFHSVALLGTGLVVAGSLIGSFRAGDVDYSALAGPAQFVAGQGVSLNITEVAVAYRRQFSPHIISNLSDELRSAFFPTDHTKYEAGKNFDADVSMFLNPIAYQAGSGGGSSYVAEAYLAGGLLGVVIVSALIGALFNGMQRHARNPFALFIIAMILPDVLLMPRGGLLDWVSALLRVAISVLLLLTGWYFYRTVSRIGALLSETNRAFVHRVDGCQYN